MLREQRYLILWIHRVLDLFLTVLAYIGAYFIKEYILPAPFRGLLKTESYQTLLFMIIIIWYLCFRFFNLYESFRKQTFGQIFWKLVKAVFTGMLILILIMYILRITDVSRIMMGIFFLLNIGVLSISKGIVFKLLARYRQKGFNLKSILIVGSMDGAKEVIAAIGDRLETGFRVIGCLEIDQNKVGASVKNGIRVIATIEELQKILRNEVVDELIFAMPLKMIDQVEKYIDLAEQLGVTVRILPQWHIKQIGYKPKICSIRIEEFLGLYTMTLSTGPNEQTKLLIKSILDHE